MYHRPRMCRTCLQMSRGDFKFVSLDAGDPLWESNSPNLKEQLLTLVPEMKLDGSGTVMCTSCFIALRTAYEFKKMCQYTEQRFQNYNYKYRRPFGVGPGSAQFHVTLNETRKSLNNKNGYYGCQNINFLQADTSIDITEHHLYDASKPPPRKDFLKDPIIDQVIKTPIESLPSSKVEDKSVEVIPVEIKPVEAKPIIESKPIEIKPLIPEKPVELKPAIQIKLAEVIKEIKVPEIKRQQVARKKITASLHIRKKYKIGSEISILKSEIKSVSKADTISENKNVNKLDLIIKRACDEIEYLKENYITPKSLSCYSKIIRLSKPDNLEQLSKEANAYYFDALEAEVSCKHCSKTFDTKYKLNMHDIETHPDKQVFKCSECVQEFVHEINLKQHIDDDHTKPVIPNLEEDKVPLEKIIEETKENKAADVEMIEIEKKLEDDPLIEAQSEVLEDSNDKLKENKESNIELEKDALLVVSKVVEDKLKLDDGKKYKPSYEDDDEDFILEDNAFNISDSEDESIDIEINESEINQLLQDDYEGKIIKNITGKTSEANKKVKEEKVLSKSPYIMILPKPAVAESVKIEKTLSNFVVENQVEKLLSKKQIEEKVNKLAEIQFVEVKRVLPNRQANTSTAEDRGLPKNLNAARESKELSKTNLNLKNLENKIQKEEVQKVTQKSRFDVSNPKDNVRKEIPKLTLLSQFTEGITKKELSKASTEKVQKEAPKPAVLTITKVEKEVSKHQTAAEKLSPKKLADAPTIASKPKESPKAKVNVQNEKNKAQKESPKKQDKPIVEKGNKVKETSEVKKDLIKNQEKPNPEKGNKQKEKQDKDKQTVEKGNKVKESSEVKTDVQSELAEVKLAVQKESSKNQDEVQIEIRQESSKNQDASTLANEIELQESAEMETDVPEQSLKEQDELAIKHGNILQESDAVEMAIVKESPIKQDKLTPEKGNKVKDSSEAQAEVQKESQENHDKSTPVEETKLKESTEDKNEFSKKQDKSTPEKINKLKEVQTESRRIPDRSPLKRGSKLKEPAEVEKELSVKQNKSTPEKKNKLKEVQAEVQSESRRISDRSPLKRGSKLKESTEVDNEMSKKQDKSTPEKKNKPKESPKVQAEVQRESPKNQDKSTLEKRNKVKESTSVKKELFKKQDKSTSEKKNKLKELPEVQGEVQKKSLRNQDKSTSEKGNKPKESAAVKKELFKKQDKPSPKKENKLKEAPVVLKISPKKQDQATPEKESILKESPEAKVDSISEIQKDSSGSREEINKPEETSEVKIGDHNEDISSLQAVNVEKQLSEIKADTRAEVPAKSPKKQNITVFEAVNNQKELPEAKLNAQTEVVEKNSKQENVTPIDQIKSVEIEVVQKKISPPKPDMPILEKENVPIESPKIIANTQTEVQMGSRKQDMPTLENVNKEFNEESKMHLDPPVLENEINIELPQVQLNPENKVVEMDVDIPVLEKENSIELLNMQSGTPEKKEVEATYVKPYWYKYINYVKCFICQKLCRNKLQLLQHCKFVHVPTTTIPPEIVQNEEVVKITEKTAATTEIEAIKIYKKDDTPYKCNICDKQVLAKEYLDIHMHIHIPYSFVYDNDRVDNFICYICNKTFPKDRFMKLHNLQVHQTKHTVCKICNRLFKSEFWYSRHKCLVAQTPPAVVEEKPEVEDDAQINPHICNVCDRRFGRLRFLKSHQHRMHPEAYKINFGDLNASTSGTLSESVTEASPNVNLKDVKENILNVKGESADSKPVTNIIDDEVKFLKSSESNYKRKSTDRMPKLQCDFCGTMINENLYDSHIYEHNKKRMQKGRKSDEKSPDSTTTTLAAETSTNVTPAAVASEEAAATETTPNLTPVPEKAFMKCDFCFRVFQRKYHLVNHIKKHHGDLSQSAEVQSGNEESEAAEECEESETSRNESMEMLECCGRQFKLKAHYARHCSTKHPDVFYKTTPSKPASPIPTPDVSGVVSTRRSNTYKAKENDNESVPPTEEPVKEKRIIKRKTLDLIEPTESVKKPKVISSESVSTPETLKRKKSSESDGESARKKKVPPPAEVDDQDTSLFKYQCSTCARKFKQYNQLRDHNNVHTGDRPYKCFFCEPVRGFTQTSSLYVHFRRVHVSIVNNVEWEPYSKNGVCLICSSVFEKHTEMFQHAKDYYVEEGFKCDVCEQNYTMSCHHRVHSPIPFQPKQVETDSSDTVESPTRCDPCDKVFATQHMFRFHKKSLAHVQQVQTLKKQSNRKKSDGSTTIEGLANSVGDILKTLSGMKKHKHYKHKCYACGKTFNKRVNLKIHRRQKHRKKSRDSVEEEQKASSSTDVPILDENEILKSITAKRRPSVLSENSDDKIDNQTDLEECDDNMDQSSQSSCSQDDEFESIKSTFDDSADFDAMKLVESLQLPDDVIDEVIANETSSEILCSQMKSAVEEIAFNVGYPSSSDDFPQDIIESDGVTYTKMRGVPIDSLE